MKNYFNSNLRDTFPPTPSSFTVGIRHAMKALPRKRPARYWPAIAAATATIAACAALAAVLLNLNIPTKDIVNKPTSTAPSLLASAPAPDTRTPLEIAAGETDTPQPTPPPTGPLAQLTMTTPDKAPGSADGWQAAAVSGAVTWYYRKDTSEVARVEENKTVAIVLDVPQGQIVDTYTFLPAQDGRWLAFTVHGSTGDSVWLITKDGRKMNIPDDVHWVDSNHQPLQIDLTGMVMTPYGSRLEFPTAKEDIDADVMIDDIELCIQAPDGTVYWTQVALDTSNGYTAFTFNDRRGYLGYNQNKLKQGEAIITSKELMYVVRPGDNGKYLLEMKSGQPAPVTLASNQFALFKSTGDEGKASRLGCALLIYKDDPDHTLWELNIETGNTKKVATGCLAADWVDGTTYWYASGKDSAVIHRKAAAGMKAVALKSVLEANVYPADYPSDMAGKVTLRPEVRIQNNTDEAITVPGSVDCSLTIRRDGKVIWEKKGDYSLADAKEKWIGKIGKGGYQLNEPYTVKAGYELTISLGEIVYEEPGTYTLEGQFYGKQVNFQIKLPQAMPMPAGVTLTPSLDKEGRLSIAYENSSHNEFWIPQARDNNNKKQYPPTVCFRLFTGDKEVKHGLLPMAAAPLTAKEGTIPTGGTYTLVEPGATPCLAGLAAGEYRLECYMQINPGEEVIPWGFAGSDYFDLTFTIPEK